jgi:desulfoferrodoxin-like iron-binding protein
VRCGGIIESQENAGRRGDHMPVEAAGERYRCNICGNVVVVEEAGGGTLVCCDEEMERLPE